MERALNITEVLEAILLAMHDGYHTTPQPHLYALKRVNRQFRNTIDHSLSLQRQMWLAYEADDSQARAIEPISWLGWQGLIPMTRPHTVNLCEPRFYETDFYLGPATDHDALPPEIRQWAWPGHSRTVDITSLNDNHSSWRSMKLSRFLNPRQKRIKWPVVLRHCDENLSTSMENPAVAIHYLLDFDEEQLGTLGQLYDLINKIQLRTIAEHVKCYKEAAADYWTERQREYYDPLEEGDREMHEARDCSAVADNCWVLNQWVKPFHCLRHLLTPLPFCL
jgi:hypothetical protein